MTIEVANTANTNSFTYLKNRVNELADSMTNYVVTTDSNTAVGNAAISGTFTANSLTANTITLANSTVNTTMVVPSAAEISAETYFLNANGSWVSIGVSSAFTRGNTTTTGTSQQIVDTYATSTYKAAEYFLHVDDNNANAYVSTKILTTHVSDNAYMTEYGTLVTNSALGVFAVTANGTHVRLLYTPTSTNTTITFNRITL